MKGRWHDNRHTLVTELAEGGAGDQVITSIAGHVSRAMLSRYSHVRMEAKRRALDEIAARQREADEKRLKDAQRRPRPPAAKAFRALHLNAGPRVADSLRRTQPADGSWANAENLVKEDDPPIASAFGMRALICAALRVSRVSGLEQPADCAGYNVSNDLGGPLGDPNTCHSAAISRRASLGQIQGIWKDAAAFDASLTNPHPKLLPELSRKRIIPERFSRSRLFSRILAGEPSLFSHCPIRLHSAPTTLGPASVLEEIRSGFPSTKRARVRCEDSIQYLPIPAVLARWMRAKKVFGVTDLHYVNTRFDSRLNTDALNDFNLLSRGVYAFQSQDSLVISSTGAVTDSHSDDHSGSNHCFVGAKLWLMWDTIEGLEHGLQDAERCDVYGRAQFDVNTFLTMRSSRWLLIADGQTIFMPGHLTHKVITLRQYLGLGSFYAALPSFIDSLNRWSQLPPLWANQSGDGDCCSVAFIARRAIQRLKVLRKATGTERSRWGVPFLQARLHQLQSIPDHAALQGLSKVEDLNFKAFIRAAQRL